MALAVFSRAQHDPPAAQEASMTYQKLLQTAQKTICDLDQNNVVPCLLAAWFMGRYEHAEARPNYMDPRKSFALQLQSFKHHDGALAILKTWKERLSHDQPVPGVVKHIRRGQIKSAILRSHAIPTWMSDGNSFGEQDLDLEYDRIILELTNIRHRLSLLLSKEQKPESTPPPNLNCIIDGLINEITDLDEAVSLWATQIPDEWSPELYRLSDPSLWPTPDFLSPVVYSYSSLARAAVWNQYYATRMLINNTLLKMLDLVIDDAECATYQQQQRFEASRILDDMANRLASSMPFCLHRIDILTKTHLFPQQESVTLTPYRELKPYVANLVVWPLSIASGLRKLDVGQQIWFRSQLARLGKLVSSRLFECADTRHWMEL